MEFSPCYSQVNLCMPCFKSVVSRVYTTKVPFLAFFVPYVDTEMGVVIYMYLYIPQIILILIYMGSLILFLRFKCFC